jgi:hypothetical protein
MTASLPRQAIALAWLKSIGLTCIHWIRLFPVCWLIVALSLIVKENYPFSNNPMYARWEPFTYVLHTTDENDKVLLFENEFGQTAIKLKKVVKSGESRLRSQPGLSKEDRYRIAAENALKFYHEKRSPKVENPSTYQTIKLWQTDFWIEDGEVKKKAFVLAQYSPKGAQP